MLPSQCIRYCYDAAQLLWPAPGDRGGKFGRRADELAAPGCGRCGAARLLEFQLMPPLLFYLGEHSRAQQGGAAGAERAVERGAAERGAAMGGAEGGRADGGGGGGDDDDAGARWLTVAAFVCPHGCVDRGAATEAAAAGGGECWYSFRREHAAVCWEPMAAGAGAR
jgi:hypothetical protein